MACNETLINYIMLSRVRGLGPVSANRLIRICGSAEACFSMEAVEILGKAPRTAERSISMFLRAREDPALHGEAEEIIEACLSDDIRIICREDPEYPERFKSLPDMPILLYARGRLAINQTRRSIGIVGARRCSREGKERAILIAQEAVSENAIVISGMAKGIDSYAHTSALLHGGNTIAVLGNGPDICYPKEHAALMERIIETGAIVAEYPPGTKPRPYSFPMRNRLIAAMSDTLYVVDTDRNSGTASTIESALKYKRQVIQCRSQEKQ